MFWSRAILKKKRQRMLWSVEQLKYFIFNQFLLSKLQYLVFSIPKWTELLEEVMQDGGKHVLVPTLKMLCCHHFKKKKKTQFSPQKRLAYKWHLHIAASPLFVIILVFRISKKKCTHFYVLSELHFKCNCALSSNTCLHPLTFWQL